MGTLLDQPVRRYYPVEGIQKEIEEFAQNHNMTIAKAADRLLILEKIALCRMQQSDFDVKDEQLAGFGELFREFSLGVMGAIDTLSGVIGKNKGE